jgi:hypothetical protein
MIFILYEYLGKRIQNFIYNYIYFSNNSNKKKNIENSDEEMGLTSENSNYFICIGEDHLKDL